MRKVQIREVIKSLKTGVNPRKFFALNTPDADNYYVTIREMINGKIVFSDATDKINADALSICNKRSNLERGDVLFSGTGTIGKVVVLDSTPMNWNIKEGIYSLKPKTEVVLPNYLSWALRSDVVTSSYMEHIAGIGVKSLKMFDLEQTLIPLPSLEEQKCISHTLDTIQSSIDIKKKELLELDELVQSKFVEMFGGFPSNEYGWNICKIRDLVTDVRYGTSIKAAEGNSGQYPYIRMSNMTNNGELDFSDMKTIDVPEKELSKCSVKKGDLLFNRTNSYEFVGKTAVYNRDELMVLAGFIIRVRLKESVLPEFLSSFLNTDFSKRMLRSLAKQAVNQANINAQEMQNIEVYLPPVELQKEFCDFKEKVLGAKELVKKQISDLEELMNSKMDEYFS